MATCIYNIYWNKKHGVAPRFMESGTTFIVAIAPQIMANWHMEISILSTVYGFADSFATIFSAILHAL